MKLSVVVPCYNEEKNLALLAKRFSRFAKGKKDIEIIFVNNGSADNSEKVMSSLCRQYGFLRIVNIKKNIGYGNGIYRGLKKAKGDFLSWTHADLQTDPKDVFTAYNIIKKQKNPEKIFVKGNRRKRDFINSIFTFGMTLLVSIISKKLMHDINAQPNLFHKSFLKRLENTPKDFNFDLYVYYMAKKYKLRIIRFPVRFKKRIYGKSHWDINFISKIKHIKEIIRYSLKLRKG